VNDPFSILGLPRTFALTPEEVQAAHLRVVAELHPDRAQGALDRDERMRRSAAAGHAKQALLGDLGRAEALVAALVPATLPASAEGALPPAFLMEMLEVREAIEAALESREGLEALESEVAERRRACVAEVAGACADLERAPDEATAQEVHRALARLRYVERMRTRLSEAAETA